MNEKDIICQYAKELKLATIRDNIVLVCHLHPVRIFKLQNTFLTNYPICELMAILIIEGSIVLYEQAQGTFLLKNNILNSLFHNLY